MKKFPTKIGWWLWATLLFAATTLFAVAISSPGWMTALYAIAITAAIALPIAGCRYAIEGDTLLVYQFFRPTSLPIRRIKEVRYCRGYSAGPAMSLQRLSISFSDRSVLRSSMPLEISPADRDALVAELLRINPSITVIR